MTTTASVEFGGDESASVPVGRLAELAGVSVRTLHHYDAIGLLEPTDRSTAGYRLYSGQDIERLQRILFYRELGFPLSEIDGLLQGATPEELLLTQRGLLEGRVARLQAMIRAIDTEMEAHTMNYSLTPEERLEVWGEYRPEDYEAEVQERWGDTDAYAESARRTKNYTADDWRAIKAEGEANTARMVAALRAGLAPDSDEAMAAAEDARLHIDRWFYPISHELHATIAGMYVSDPRFTKNFEKEATGLAEFTTRAIVANSARASG